MIDEKIALQATGHRGYCSAQLYGTEVQDNYESSAISINVLSPLNSAVPTEDRWTARRLLSLGTLGTAACLALWETQAKMFLKTPALRSALNTRSGYVAGLPPRAERVDPAQRSLRTGSTAMRTLQFGTQAASTALAVRPVSNAEEEVKQGERSGVQKRFDEAKGVFIEDDGKGYHPEFWNTAEVQRRNNCYNYATNRRTDTFAQPGRGAGLVPPRYNILTCETVDRRARADGLRPHVCKAPCSDDAEMHVFLSVAPGADFHWYREHKDTRRWSHKRGPLPVSNTDFKGNAIDDPNQADRGPYTDACGCYCVPENATII